MWELTTQVAINDRSSKIEQNLEPLDRSQSGDLGKKLGQTIKILLKCY